MAAAGLEPQGIESQPQKRIHLFEKIAAMPATASTTPITMREANFHEIIVNMLSIRR